MKRKHFSLFALAARSVLYYGLAAVLASVLLWFGHTIPLTVIMTSFTVLAASVFTAMAFDEIIAGIFVMFMILCASLVGALIGISFAHAPSVVENSPLYLIFALAAVFGVLFSASLCACAAKKKYPHLSRIAVFFALVPGTNFPVFVFAGIRRMISRT